MSPNLLETSNNDEATSSIAVIEQNSKVNNSVEQKMLGVHLVENSNKEKGWELFANEAVGTSDSHWVLKNVKVQFFNDNKSNYVVVGDVGEIDGNSKDMVIRGNVRTDSSNGYSFKTDTLVYSAKQKTMTSNDSVYMEGPDDNSGKGFKLKGEKLLVDVVKNQMSILDKVFATKTIKLKDFKLNSQRADFSNYNQEADFSGDVKMRLGSLDVQSPSAKFSYSNLSQSLVKVFLNGGVEFTEKDRKGSCKELEMDIVENKMTMRGQPKVQQGEDEIKGHEIVFIDGGKKVKINKTPRQGSK